MGPGLPGFGIASIFYICAAIVAPFRLLPRKLRGQVESERWSSAITQFLIGSGMLIALVAFYMALDYLARRGVLATTRGPEILVRIPNWVFAAVTLLVVLLAGSISGAIASSRSPDDPPHEIAAAHRAGVVEVIRELRATYARRDRARRRQSGSRSSSATTKPRSATPMPRWQLPGAPGATTGSRERVLK